MNIVGKSFSNYTFHDELICYSDRGTQGANKLTRYDFIRYKDIAGIEIFDDSHITIYFHNNNHVEMISKHNTKRDGDTLISTISLKISK